MRSFNRELAVVAASVAAALGTTACGASPNTNRTGEKGVVTTTSHPKPTQKPNIANRLAVITEGSTQVIYYKDGSREVVFHESPELANQAFYVGDVFQVCVNGLIYSQTEGLDEPDVNRTKDGTFSGTPNTQIISSSWATTACADGVLTPSDFSNK